MLNRIKTWFNPIRYPHQNLQTTTKRVYSFNIGRKSMQFINQ